LRDSDPNVSNQNPDPMSGNPDVINQNPDLTDQNPDLIDQNPDVTNWNPDLIDHNLDLSQQNSTRIRDFLSISSIRPVEPIHVASATKRNPWLLRGFGGNANCWFAERVRAHASCVRVAGLPLPLPLGEDWGEGLPPPPIFNSVRRL